MAMVSLYAGNMSRFANRFSMLVLLSGVGYVLSFCSQLVISYHFGTSPALDAYWTVFAIANFLLFYVHPVREAIVPELCTAAGRDLKHANAILSAGLVLQSVLAAVSVSILVVFPERLAAWLSDRGGSGGQVEIGLLYGFLPYLLLFALAETLAGLLVYFDLVVYQSIARLLSGLAGFLCVLLLGERWGIFAMLFSVLLGQGLALTASAIGLRARGLRWQWKGFDVLRKGTFSVLLFSLLVNYLLAQVYVVYEKTTMLKMMPGLLASYQYSVSLVNVLVSMIAFPLANLLCPRFRDQQGVDSKAKMLELAGKAAAPLGLVLLVCCVFVYWNAKSIIFIVFARGAFDEGSLLQTTEALRATVFAAVPIGIMAIFSSMLLTQGHARAMAAMGMANALSGMSVIAVGAWLDNVSLVRWHWLVGNTAGMLVVLWMTIWYAGISSRAAARSLFWILKVIVIVVCVMMLVPSFTFGIGKLGVLVGLGVQFGLSAALVVALSVLAGVVDFRQWIHWLSPANGR